MSEPFAAVLSGLVLAAFLFVAGLACGASQTSKTIRTEAVERGFAEWVPDKEGNTTFKWKEVAK